jgi:NADPH:quinone reductase-like Zn-dependent oxidoreductase
VKAAVLEHYGEPSEFVLKTLNAPTIGDGQILVRNRASSVNPVDVMVREGAFRIVSGLFGDQIIGSDFSGVVLESKSNRFKTGDEVYGAVSPTNGAAYASELAADEDVVALKPATISFAEAAALPVVALTAYQALQQGNVKAGDHVLVNGCTGGVGCAAVQLAKHMGATVTGTCSPAHTEAARELGCDTVLDYDQLLPADQQYDLIFDTAGKMILSDVDRNLTEEAVLITTKPDTKGFSRTMSTLVDLVKPRMKQITMKANTADLTVLKELIEQGKFKSYVARTFPLEQMEQAHNMLEAGGFVGKIAISID